MSMRDIVKALHSNYSYRQLCLLEKDIPSIATLSYRNAKMNYHALIQSTVILYELESSLNVEITTVDSTIVKPCSDHRAQLQRRNHKYKDRHAFGLRVRRRNGNTDTKPIYLVIVNHPWC